MVILNMVLSMCLSQSIQLDFFRLKPIDIKFMRSLHDKVNIVPVIAKADTLTKTEIRSLKARVSILNRM